MKISSKALEIIKQHEGLRLEAYHCPSGVITIGYGHTGEDVYSGQTITQEQASQFLIEDVDWAEDVVNSVVLVDLNQNEFDALVSFVFNIGSEAFSNSTLLEYLNKNKREQASAEFIKWVHDGGGNKLNGLIKRRKKEQELFNKERKEFNFKIQAKTNTVLKIGSTQQSSQLSKNKTQQIIQDEYIFVNSYEEAENGHYKLELSFDAGTRYIFSDHWSLPWEDSNESESIKKEIEPQNNDKPLTIDDVDWTNFDSPVSKHFTVGEVTQWDARRIPQTNTVKQNVLNLAIKLDGLREEWGDAIGVTSWYRPYNINRAVGGVPNSQHLTGKAVDIYPYNGKIWEFQEWLDEEMWSDRALGYGAEKGFIHLDKRKGNIRWDY